jgi:hypothetical protein
MVSSVWEPVELPVQQPVSLLAECRDHPIALIAVNLDRGECLGAALVAQLPASRGRRLRTQSVSPYWDMR